MNKSQTTKSLILESANELFYHKGYHHTGYLDIEKKTGLSKGNINYHFKNKKNILKSIVEQRITRIKYNLAKYLKNSHTPTEALIKMCRGIIEDSENIKSYGCPMGTLIGELAKDDEDLHQITVEMFQTYIGWISNRYIDLGLSNKKAIFEAKSLLGRLQGIALMTHTMRDPSFFKREIKKIELELKTME